MWKYLVGELPKDDGRWEPPGKTKGGGPVGREPTQEPEVTGVRK